MTVNRDVDCGVVCFLQLFGGMDSVQHQPFIFYILFSMSKLMESKNFLIAHTNLKLKHLRLHLLQCMLNNDFCKKCLVLMCMSDTVLKLTFMSPTSHMFSIVSVTDYIRTSSEYRFREVKAVESWENNYASCWGHHFKPQAKMTSVRNVVVHMQLFCCSSKTY